MGGDSGPVSNVSLTFIIPMCGFSDGDELSFSRATALPVSFLVPNRKSLGFFCPPQFYRGLNTFQSWQRLDKKYGLKKKLLGLMGSGGRNTVVSESGSAQFLGVQGLIP